MEENNDNEDRVSSIHDELKEIFAKIRESYHRDSDETKYMIKFIKMLKEMLTHSTLEEYFSNNEELLTYFMGNFLSEVIKYILIQKTIIGENGDDIALDLLLHIFKLFLKFHKNEKYSPLFEKIRTIFKYDNNFVSFYTSHKFKDDEDETKYNYSYFNEQFCAEFKKKLEKKSFKVDDEVDFLVEKNIGKNEFEKKFWARGKIKEIKDDQYVIQYFDDEEKIISVNDFNIFEKNSKAKDWDWRSNLKKWDIVDCFDRNKWFPATITDVKEMENNGYKNNIYNVAFRLYPKHFKNPENENDTFDKHIDLWKNAANSEGLSKDRDGEEYIGDPDNFSEELPFYSKRIQKFNLYSSIQLKNLDYQSTGSNSNKSNDRNPLNVIIDNLIKETDTPIDDFFNFEVNGKKNYVLGKTKYFYYYYARLLKLIENENSFSEFIEILKDKASTEEIYNIFYILTYCFPYLHKDYFIKNEDIIKNSLIRYINDLKEKEMRNLPKDLINIVTNLLYNINEYNKDVETDDNKKDTINSYDEVAITLSLKTIKTSIFDRRLQGIKTLNDFIDKNQKNKDVLKKLIALIKEKKIMSEIFGANYHSQLISRSNEIVKLLSAENELENDDIKLIWSCTKRGDLEAKLIILKLLSEISPYLKEEYIEILLNNIISNIDQKISKEEIDLVNKLSTQENSNEKNIMLCCDYLCKCLLMSNNSNIKDNQILGNLLSLIEKDDKYLKNVLDICENYIKNNDKTILSYSILTEIMEKYLNNEKINEFTKDQHLLHLFEDNFKLYVKQTKELLAKNNISFSEGEKIDKFIVDGFSHLDNVQKRMDVYPFLINKLYTDYDFIPFLKGVLIDNPVSPNDQLIYYDFVKKYISNNENTSEDAISRKEKIRQQLFDLLSENKEAEITVEKLNLFIALFIDMNKVKNDDNKKEAETEMLEVENIEELKGLDRLWNIIFQIKDEKTLSVGISKIFEIYKNKNLDKLLEKCNNLIKEENATSETIDKCVFD